MIVPLCPICGHQMYFAGLVKSVLNSFIIKRYVCVHCDHVEDMISAEEQKKEFLG